MNSSRVLCSILSAGALALPKLKQREVGVMGTHAWRMYFTAEEDPTTHSAWHDLPLHPASDADASIITFVCEIPKGSRAKLELMKEEPHNPLAQDVYSKKEGKPLRYFTYGDIPFNYGFAPQTWEDPSVVDNDTRCRGDGDPIDIVQLSKTPAKVGSIQAVRVLGVLGLIDEGETDWKIITETLHSGEDTYGSLSTVPMELKSTIVQWFRDYKTTDGKKRNELAYGGEIRGVTDALHVIENCSRHYAGLLAGTSRNPGYWLS